MKTPPLVYAIIALLVLIGGIVFFNREPVLAPDPVSPVITEPAEVEPSPAVSAYGSTKVKLGQVVSFPDFTLTPLSVVSDSRCPSDATCVWAGTLTLEVGLLKGNSSSKQVIEIGKPASYGEFSLTLTAVSPLPKAENPVTSTDYVFTITAEKKAPVVTAPVAQKCYVGGCSSEICSDSPDVASTCIFREEYACYAGAECKRQASGQCGWTQTEALKMCISSAQSNSAMPVQ